MAKSKFHKVPLKFDIETLNMIISYLLTTNNKLISRGHIVNIKQLFDLVDMKLYENSDTLEMRVNFIKRALEARLDLNMENPKIILNYCTTNKNKNIVENDIGKSLNEYKLSGQEIKYINSMIADRLKYIYLYTYKDMLIEVIDRLESGEFDSFKLMNDEFERVIVGLLNEIRKVKSREISDLSFDLTAGNMEDVVIQIVEKLKRPSNKLRSGIKALNEFVADGFESQRLYTFLGLPGVGKSTILLSVANWLRKYNKVETKDSLKRPAILFITQENSIEETVARLFNMTCTAEDIKNFTPSEVTQMLREKGNLVLKNNDDIDLIIKYYPHRSISTSDLYTILDELSDSGVEVIALVHDYLKRIRATEMHPEIRIELGNVTNELKTLAQSRDIPVITAMQLNRSGASTIDAAAESNKSDITRLLGRANVGESWNIIENSDWVTIINKEMKDDIEYMVFKRIKCRFRASKMSYFVHPFEKGNEIKLIEDVELPHQVSLKSIYVENTKNLDLGKKGRQSARPVIEEDDFQDNTFDFAKIYNGNIGNSLDILDDVA